MNITTEGLLIILVIGIVAGWLAGLIVQGTGFGIVGDFVVGIVGAFIGSLLIPQFYLPFREGLAAAILSATLGAVVLLLIIGLFNGRRVRSPRA